MRKPHARTQYLAAVAMAAIGGLHVLWATGSNWPAKNAAALADTAAGREASAPPGPLACVTVAGLLFSAAALTGGHPRQTPRIRRLGSIVVSATFLLRGAAGVTGQTHQLAPGAVSDRFQRLDRHLYGPLCLAIGVLSLPATTGKGT